MLQDASAYLRMSHLNDVHGIPDARGAEWIHHALGVPTAARLNVGIAKDAPVEVYVNHGRWVVECPDCNGAQLACRTDPRFMCNECGNVVCGNLWRPVVWPPNSTSIDSMLQNRPVRNQHWYPAESKTGLAIENLMHMGRIK